MLLALSNVPSFAGIVVSSQTSMRTSEMALLIAALTMVFWMALVTHDSEWSRDELRASRIPIDGDIVREK
jgi:hypothetical protein